MINLAQVGCGYWGPNLLRNFYSLEDIQVKSVVELDNNRVNYIKRSYPNIYVTNNFNKILNDDEIDAVVVATPADTHYDLTKKILNAEKHCFVEKPLAFTKEEAGELLETADKNNLTLMVGHTFLYNAAVRDLKKRIDRDELGDIYYIYSQRLNLGRIRRDVNALWNLAPHDISIILHIIDSKPISVTANGVSYIQNDIEDVVFMTLRFQNEVIANVHVSWLDPNKIRRMTVVGNKKMVVYDDTSDYKIQIYDCGIDKKKNEISLGRFNDFGEFQLIKRAGDVYLPKINFIEPLKEEARHFIDCILKRKKPISDGKNGYDVVQILEASMRSIRNNSKEVLI